MEEKKNKVTAIILLKVVEEEIEKIIDSEFANENDYTDYAAIDKMLALLASIEEVISLLHYKSYIRHRYSYRLRSYKLLL